MSDDCSVELNGEITIRPFPVVPFRGDCALKILTPNEHLPTI